MYILVDSTPGTEISGFVQTLEVEGCDQATREALVQWKSSVSEETSGEAFGRATKELLRSVRTPAVIVVNNDLPPKILDEWAEFSEETKCLFFYTRPERVLLQEMRDGRSPSGALDQWLDSAERILRTFRRYRDKVILLEMNSAYSSRSKVSDICREEFGVAPSFERPAPPPDVSSSDLLHNLIARQMVAQSEYATSLLSELHAASSVMDKAALPHKVDWDRAFSALELFGNLREENELLLSQLNQMEREQNEDLDHAREEVSQLRQELSKIRNSRSWKITRPLRLVGHIRNRSKTSPGK